MNETTTSQAPTTAPALDTYDGIRAARKTPGVLPTQEQFEKVLSAQRQLVADLAVASAVASGERFAEDRLDLPKEKIDGKPSASDLRHSFDKAHRHLSKLVYWFGKFQTGKFHELHLSPKFAAQYSAPSPDDGYSPDESDEDSDEDNDTE